MADSKGDLMINLRNVEKVALGVLAGLIILAGAGFFAALYQLGGAWGLI